MICFKRTRIEFNAKKTKTIFIKLTHLSCLILYIERRFKPITAAAPKNSTKSIWGHPYKTSGRPHKIAKIAHLVKKMFTLAHLSPPRPCAHTINFEKSEVFAPWSANFRIWRTPLSASDKLTSPLTADSFYR